MQLFETEEELRDNLLRHDYIYEIFDNRKLSELSKIISDPSKTIMFLISKTLDESNFTRKEQWYNINYSAEKYTADQLHFMNNPKINDNGKKLYFPPQNPFLPKDLNILPKSKKS